MDNNKLGALYWEIGGKTDDLNRSIDQSRGQMKSLASRMDEVGKKMTATGKKMTMALTLPIVAGFAAAVKATSDFESRLSDVSTLISGDSTESIAQLKEGILEMLEVVPKSADELGASAYSIMSAGITDVSDALKVLETSAKLATAGLSTTEEATDIMTSAINAFGFEAEDSSEVADLLFNTVKAGKTTIAELSQSFGASAPTIAAAKVSLQEFSAATAALTISGLPASQAQQQLRQSVVSLIKPTQQMEELLKKIGFESGSAALKQLGLVGTMEALTKAAGGNTQQVAEAFGSVEALNAALALTGPAADAFTETMDLMREGSGNMAEAFSKQAETIGARTQLLKNRFTILAVNIGEQLIPVLENLGEKISGIIDWYERLGPHQRELVLQFLSIVAVAGPVLIVVGKITQALAALRIAMAGTAIASGALAGGAAAGGAAAGGIAAIAAPALLATVAIGGLAFGAYKLWQSARDADQQFGELGETTATAAGSATLLELAHKRVNRATNDVEASTTRLKDLKREIPAINREVASSEDLLARRQRELNRAIEQYGEDSPQAQIATENLEAAQVRLNGKLRASASSTLAVAAAKNDLRLANDRLSWATNNLDFLTKALADNTMPGLRVSMGRVEIQAQDTTKTVQRTISSTTSNVLNLNGKIGRLQGTGSQTQRRLQATFNAIQQDITTTSRNLNQLVPSGGFKLQVTGTRARGGPVEGGGTYLTGEKGAELFVPESDGFIINNSMLDRLTSLLSGNKQAMIPSMAGGPKTNFYGDVNIYDKSDASSILRKITQNQYLQINGVATGAMV